ncbi:hypothetical protein CGLO_04274 [Colletotrichum gloeosporioides Cg-14]|uniref:Uncharacterized protein n=1 Tax=Colletotrichum gloeosporioides (strain Cg-14) TaxID=1237896 RepID=T0KSX3_COLGC|nr:hypothetical protein CGLO_04274 [Colletotrichum gloeosporioides Cg-14]
MDAAPFYKKLGFAKVGGFRISIPAKNGGEETYEEALTRQRNRADDSQETKGGGCPATPRYQELRLVHQIWLWTLEALSPEP